MTDYGHPITFGLSLTPYVADLDELRELSSAADRAGLDYLAIQDHAYNSEFFDTWTLLTYLTAETERITFVPDVADLQLRPPTMLAKAASSLSVLSGGRIVLGVGGGASADGIAAMGGIRRSPPEMVEFTEEAIEIMRAALRGGDVALSSSQHAVEGYAAGPIPVAPIPIWLGSQAPRMLEVTGRSSDGWVSPLNVYMRPPLVPDRQRAIDDAARAAGRHPAEIRRIYNVVGSIVPSDAGMNGSGLIGDVAAWIEALTGYAVDLGFDTFILWPRSEPLAQLDVFAREVVPGVREAVAARRSTKSTS